MLGETPPVQVTPDQATAEPADPHGYDVAMAPLQSQPLKAIGDIVGVLEGANDVGDTDGAMVGAAVGVAGQLVMPSLKAHKALASDCCWADPVGAILATLGAKVGIYVKVGMDDIVGKAVGVYEAPGVPQSDVTGVAQS